MDGILLDACVGQGFQRLLVLNTAELQGVYEATWTMQCIDTSCLPVFAHGASGLR